MLYIRLPAVCIEIALYAKITFIYSHRHTALAENIFGLCKRVCCAVLFYPEMQLLLFCANVGLN